MLSVATGSQPFVYTSTGIGGTGTLYYANVNPSNINEIYVESDVGPVFHTTNDGLTWTTLNDQLALNSLEAQNFVQYTDTSGANAVQFAINGNHYTPDVTNNDGQTWTTLAGWSQISSNGGDAAAIWVNPNSTSQSNADVIVLEDVESGSTWKYWYWFSTNGGNSFFGGSNDMPTIASGSVSYEPWAAGAFFDPNGNNFYFATDTGLYVSTNSGGTWTAASDSGLAANTDFMSFTGSDQGGTTKLWAVTWNTSAFAGEPPVLSNGTDKSEYGGIYTSSNAGASWTNMNGTTWAQTTGPSVYPVWVQMIDDNINDVWAGGGDTGGDAGPAVYATTNGGTSTWTRLLDTGSDPTSFNDSPGAVIGIAMNNGGSGYSSSFAVTFSNGGTGGSGATATAYATNGVLTSVVITNVGSGYTSAPTISFSAGGGSGATETTTMSLLGSAELPNQNVYTHQYGQGGSFSWGYVGQAVSLLVDRSNSQILTLTVGGTLFESADGGQYWYDLTAGGPTTNGGTLPNSDWNPIGLAINPTASVPGSSLEETAVWNLAFVNPTTIFEDDTDVTYQISTDGGADWNFPSYPGTAVPNTFYQTVLDPVNGLLYSVTSNKHNLYTSYTDDGEVEQYGDNYLAVSSDGGQTWSTVYSFPIASAPRTLALDPDNPDVMFVGTANHLDGGIWMTTDLQDGVNSVWTRLGDGVGAAATATMSLMSGTPLFITNGGSGYASAPAVTISGTNGAAASVVSIANGAVNSVTMTNPDMGSGYTSAPTVLFSSPTSGTTATGVAVIDASDGTVTNVYITNGGSGYATAPSITFSGGLSSGGTAANNPTVTIGNGVIDAITITTTGSGYTTAPKITIAGSGGGTAVPNMSVTGLTLSSGGSLYPSTPAVYFDTDAKNNQPASATANLGTGTNSGTVVSFSNIVGGSGYTTAPVVFISSSGTNEPTRDLYNTGVQDFSAMHPEQLFVLNNSTSSDIQLLAVMDPRTPETGSTYVLPDAGIWLGTGTLNSNGSYTWIWKDQSGDSSTSTYSGTAPNNIIYYTADITIDPNDPSQETWFDATTAIGSGTAGYIYETTDAGAKWMMYSSVGAGTDMWIQPGGTAMLFASKDDGLYYSPDYTATTDTGTNTTPDPQFYQEQNFPFRSPFSIVSNPYNSDQIWITTGGDGVYETDLITLGLAAIVQNVTAQSMGPTEALVSWQDQAPLPTNYIIQSSSNGGTSWSTVGTDPGSQDSSYLVTGLTAGTLYEFQVIANNTQGNSLASVATTQIRTDSNAGLIAYEGFSYANGAGLSGQTGGTGWATGSGWVASSNATISNAAWTFPNDNTPPTSNGLSLALTSSGGVNPSRTLSSPVGTSGTVLWAGFEEESEAGTSLILGSTTNGFAFGTPYTGGTGHGGFFYGFEIFNGGTPTYYDAVSSLTTGTDHFLVARMDFESGGVYVQLFLDPAAGLPYPGGEETWESSAITNNSMVSNNGQTLFIPYPSSTWSPATETVILSAHASSTDYDEIRLGNTFGDVAPATVGTPNAPTGLTVSVPPTTVTLPDGSALIPIDYNPNELDLTWTNESQTNPQQGVYIEESTNGTSWTVIDKIVDPAAVVTSYAVTDLNAATKYYFRIGSYNSANNSSSGASYDSSVSATTDPNPPSAVTNLAVSDNNGQFDLTWSSTGATSYVLEYAPDGTNAYNDGELNWIQVSLGDTTGTSLTLPTNTLYNFRIYAVNTGGDSSCSNLVSQTAYAAPSNITATGVAPSQISLTWTDSTTAMTGFNVYWSTSATSGFTEIPSAVLESAESNAIQYQYLVTGLSANTQYYFEVQAYATGSTGVLSNPSTTGRTLSSNNLLAYEGFDYPVLPNTTNDFTGQTGGYGWTGSWTAMGTDALIEPGNLPSSSFASSADADNLLMTGNNFYSYGSGNITRTLGTPLSTSVGSSVWVSVLEEIGSTPEGLLKLITGSGNDIEFGVYGSNNYFSIQTTGSGQVNYPTSIAAASNTTYLLVFDITYGSSNNNTISLWVDPAPASSVGTSPSSSITTSGSYGQTSPITSIYIATTASGGGDSNTWDELRVGTTYSSVAPLIVPAVPTSLGTTAGSSVSLSWTESPSTDVAGYDLQVSSNSGATWTSLASGVASTTYTYTPSTGGTYEYRVSAENYTGDSVFSNVASATYVTTPVPPTITSAVGTTGSIGITLTWTETSTGVNGYDILRSTSSSGGFTNVATSLVGTLTTWTDNATNDSSYPPLGNTTYYYEVESYYVSTDPSSPSNVKSALTIPAAPTGLVATPGTSTIALTWTNPSPTTNITGYHIWRSTNDTFGASAYATVTGSSAASYTDTAVGSGTNGGTVYYYEVAAYDTTGNSAVDVIPGGLSGGVATVYAYEGFNYPTSSTWTGANTTGIGFTGNWTIANSSHASIVGGLNYNSGGNALTTSGNGLQLTDDDTATQTLSQTVGASGSTLWIGFEINPSGDSAFLLVGSTTNGVDFGWIGSDIEGYVHTSGNSYLVPGYAATANTIYFVACEIEYLTSSPVINLWIDPTPNSANGATPTGYTFAGTKTLPSTGGTLTSTTALSLEVTDVTVTAEFDEIRLGSTYASIAPDPILTSSSNNSGASTKFEHRAIPNRRTSPFLSPAPIHKHTKSLDVVIQIAKNSAPAFYPGATGAWRLVNDDADNNALFSAVPNDTDRSWQGLFN